MSLKDPVVLKENSNAASMAVIEGPVNRRTIRSSVSGDQTLSIGHQDTKENPGFDTQRTTVRNQKTFQVDDTSQSVMAYASLSLSVPKGQVTVEQLGILVAQLVTFVLMGDEPSGAGVTAADVADGALPRLYAGES